MQSLTQVSREESYRRLQGDLARSESRLAEMERSLSWRVTKPLRLISEKRRKAKVVYERLREKVGSSGRGVGELLMQRLGYGGGSSARRGAGRASLVEEDSLRECLSSERIFLRQDFPTVGVGLKIAFVVPGLMINGGGHRNILRTAYYLYLFGHEVSVFFTETALTDLEIEKEVKTRFYPFGGRLKRYSGDVGVGDLLIGTHWSTIKTCIAHKVGFKEIIYFVQDFEPFFYPMGSSYIQAESTYRRGFYHICSGPWCEYILKERFKAEADHFLFPIDRFTYQFKGCMRRDAIVFFAKPEMPRRCYEIGLAALKVVSRMRPSCEIIFFGSRHVRINEGGFSPSILSVVPSLSGLADLYNSVQLGVVFSPTNPSLVPYEMMACGLPVVDLDREGACQNYGGIDCVAKLVDSDPEVAAKAIVDLLDNEAELEARRSAGLEFVKRFPDEYGSVRRIEGLLLDRVRLSRRC